MLNITSLLVLHLVGVILSVYSFYIFRIALKTEPQSVAGYDDEIWFNTDFRTVPAIEHLNDGSDVDFNFSQNDNYDELEVFEENPEDDLDYEDESAVSNEPVFSKKKKLFKNPFGYFTSKKANVSLEPDITAFEDADDGLIHDNEAGSSDKALTSETTAETFDEFDPELVEDFPHEQRGITIFSKETISDDEIGDLKELITTIKDELSNEKKFNLQDFLTTEKDEKTPDFSSMSYENLKDNLSSRY